VKLNT
jgi:hypothetical protein